MFVASLERHPFMYILKSCGSSQIPEYIQIRDSSFTLVAYFRPENASHALSSCGLLDYQEQISEIVSKMPSGKIFSLEI